MRIPRRTNGEATSMNEDIDRKLRSRIDLAPRSERHSDVQVEAVQIGVCGNVRQG